jgi:hypothetical protein
MITDTNSIVVAGGQFLFDSAGGSWILLGFAVLLVVAVALVMAKAKIGTVVLSGTCLIFVFSLLDPAFMFMFWAALIVSLLMLVNGLRRQFTGQ